MDTERHALARQRAHRAREAAQRGYAIWSDGVWTPGTTYPPVLLRRVDGRTMQPPVRMGWIERLWRTVMGR